ncbi:metallophosphoesterase [Acidaminococcus timonensis]|uniref:metallophosphoesterase n=1 Tax=Acidaminococcus timonensis TaxID=1871002 RepID=UPI00248AC4F4|nr:metallophosphoesterase [Acidaminococcus timonensis]
MNPFFMTLLLVGLGGSAAMWALYRTGLSFLRPWRTLGLFLFLPLCFTVSNVYLHAFPRPVTRLLAWVGGLWMGLLYYAVLGAVLVLPGLLIGWLGHAPAFSLRVTRIVAGVVLLLAAGGCWWATHPVVRQVTYTTDKPVPGPYKVVFVSDLHFGGLFGTEYGKELVARINGQQPDLILLGGDIVDGDLPFVQQEGSLDTLKALRARDGIYAVYGNHDKRMDTATIERSLLEKEGIRFLVDETKPVNAWLSLNGLDDYLFGDRRARFQPETGKCNILMEHEPRRLEKAAEEGYDLYFAGHTHAGQLLPNRLITRKMYPLDYGSRWFGTMLATTSSGYGLWGVPIRSGPRPEIVVVTIIPKKD